MIKRLILIALFVLLTISPTPRNLWVLEVDSLAPYSDNNLNWQIQKSSPVKIVDADDAQDCVDTESYSLKIVDCHNKTTIKWQSPEPWKVTEVISADLNRDGENELVMVVWRKHKNWPIDSFLPSGGRIADFHDKTGMSCHLILIGWDGEKYRELWAGSSLINPIFNIRASDLDMDGSMELLALEGKYDKKNMTGDLTVWNWSGFGFRLRDRQKGSFSQFGIVSTNQNVLIMVD